MSGNDVSFFLEFVLFSGAALTWGVWQLWSVNREIAKDKAKAKADAAKVKK
jgi:hypothetical protein